MSSPEEDSADGDTETAVGQSPVSAEPAEPGRYRRAERPTAPEPRTAPAAAPLTIILAILLLGVAAVAVRELLITTETISGAPWVENAFQWFARLHWEGWMLPVAIAAVVVGLLLLFAAVKPRAKTHIALDSEAGIWLRATDVARMSSGRARTVPAVDAAHTAVGRRRATVTVAPTAFAATDDLDVKVRDAVLPSLAALKSPPALRVNVEQPQRDNRGEGGADGGAQSEHLDPATPVSTDTGTGIGTAESTAAQEDSR